jgi:hypothetical protein
MAGSMSGRTTCSTLAGTAGERHLASVRMFVSMRKMDRGGVDRVMMMVSMMMCREQCVRACEGPRTQVLHIMMMKYAAYGHRCLGTTLKILGVSGQHHTYGHRCSILDLTTQ